jgi:hypothetical protein
MRPPAFDTRGIVVISCDVLRLYEQPNCVQPQPMQSTRAVGGAVPHQSIVLVEQPLRCDVDAELVFYGFPVRIQLRLDHPVQAVLAAPPRQTVRRRAERIAPVMHRTAADRFRVVQEHRVVDRRIQAAASIEVGHRVLLALRKIFGAIEPALLHHHHVPAAFGQVCGERAATRPGSDYDHVRALTDRVCPARSLDDHAIPPKSTSYAGNSNRSGQAPSKPVRERVESSMYAKNTMNPFSAWNAARRRL